MTATQDPKQLDHADLITAGMACAVMATEMRKDGRTEVARGLDMARQAIEGILKAPAVQPPTMAPLGVSGMTSQVPGYAMSVMPAPHGKAIGQCEGCGGELRHRPDCPKVNPQPAARPALKAVT